jgi:hypothetical protein
VVSIWALNHVKPPLNRRTALSSPRFPRFAKCADKLAFALPAHTPHSDRSTLDRDNIKTLAALGNAGDRQSRIMAESLNMSAARRYILHSGSSAVPSLCAKRIVAILPIDSCSTESSSAAVGDAVASPTPTPTHVSRSPNGAPVSHPQAQTLSYRFIGAENCDVDPSHKCVTKVIKRD